MSIQPLTGQCLVRLLPHEYGGLIAHETPSEEKAKPQQAVVMAVGKWKTVKSGHAILPDIHVGQRVLVSEYKGTKLTRELGEFLRLVKIDDVLAVIQSELVLKNE